MKYKVGDRVRIRKDLKVGDVYGSCYFTREMQNFLGEVARITAVNKLLGQYRIDLYGCYWTDEMFEDIDKEKQEMHKSVTINVDGNKVVAHSDNKIGIARCHPDDKFNFYTGAKLALKRLEKSEKPYGWLEVGMSYYVPRINACDDRYLYDGCVYRGDPIDKMNIKRGIVFMTREEAIICAQKMLAAVKQEG